MEIKLASAMKRNFIIGSIVLLVGASVAIIFASKEPEYGGRTLSSWLGDLDYGTPGFDHTKFPKAEEAVRQIGPRAVPGLISMLRYEESSFSVRIRKLFDKQKLIKIKPPLSAEHIQWRGARGVWILGPTAKATIPHLIPLLTNQSSWVRGSAAMALGKIGMSEGGAMTHLTKALDDPSPDVRNCAAIALHSFGPAAREALPVLLRHLLDGQDSQTPSIMTRAFLAITNDRPVVMPSLLLQLNDPRPYVRGEAVSTLGSFGKEAQSALSVLTKLLQDPSKDVRRAVTNVINTIQGKTNSANSTSPGPKLSFRLENVTTKEALAFYGSLTGKRIELVPDIKRLGYTPITINPHEMLTVQEAIRLIEEELGEQANLVLSPSTNGVILVSSKQNGRR